MTRGRAVEGAVAVTAATALLAGCTEDSQPKPGPLEPPKQHAWSTKARPGEAFTDGLEILELRGDRPATIDAIELVDADGMKMLGARLADETREMGSIQVIRSWPPKHKELTQSSVTDAVGATLRPNEAYELLVGIAPTEEGELVRRGIRIRYTIEGEKYSRFFPAVLGICSTPEWLEREEDCPLPDGWSELPETDKG